MPENKVEMNGKKILLVEDDQMISGMYKIKFQQAGYEVVIAENGKDAIEMAADINPDIILLDIILPMVDGFGALEAIKKEPKSKNVPVIMLTNLGTDEDIAKGKELGATDYLVKASLTPGEVLGKIEQYFK
jgi:two-component system, OmpR family, alkaline phosphatase synthesis response regulator PhoP